MREEKFLRCSVWNPQHFTLFLLHDGRDLSANVGDAASLDNACNTVGVGRNIYMSVQAFLSDRAATSESSHYQVIFFFFINRFSVRLQNVKYL